MILSVHTKGIKYTSESPANKLHVTGNTVIYNCSFKQTVYGSVIIKRSTSDTLLEIYPRKITHIIHSKDV